LLKEVTLSLSGGGARGAYHLGVLHYLDEHNIKVKAICATSIGSIIGASYAAGVSPKKQLEILKSAQIKKLFAFNYFKKSIFKVNMESTLIDELIPVSKLEDLKIPLHVTAVDLYAGRELYFDSGDIKTICKASSALIPVFPAVKYENNLLADGGVINHMPIQALKKYDYPIIGVNLHPLNYEKNKNTFLGNFKRSVFISVYSSANNVKELCDFYISSQEIKKYSIFSLKNFDKLFELGYQEAKKLLILD